MARQCANRACRSEDGPFVREDGRWLCEDCAEGEDSE